MKKLGERGLSILKSAVADGSVRDEDSSGRVAALKLHSMNLLDRDPKDSGRWFPTASGRAHVAALDAEADTSPKTTEVVIALDKIDIADRLRGFDQVKVDALKPSIIEIGLQTKPTVTPVAGTDRFRLRAGLHRYMAMLQMGWISTTFAVSTMGDLDAELWEIDENLIRAELTPSDRAIFMHRRKEIYQIKHPETVNGVNQHTRVPKVLEPSNAPTPRFTKATATATGVSEERVRLDAQRGEKISDEALRLLQGTKHDKGVVLDRLKSMPSEEQVGYVRALLDGGKAGHAIGTKTATKDERREDLYETPIEAMHTLLALESFSRNVLEPSVGRAAILRPLEAAGYDVTIADLVDRGVTTEDGEYQGVGDFLLSVSQGGGPDIVTNPPYGIANAYAAHALREHKPQKMALLLNLNFLCGFEDPDRRYLMDENPPSRIYVFVRRLPMMHRDGWEGNKASSQMNTAWFVWERNEDGSYGSGYPQIIRVDWVNHEDAQALPPGEGGYAAPITFREEDEEDYTRTTPRKSIEERMDEERAQALFWIAERPTFDAIELRRGIAIRPLVADALIAEFSERSLISGSDGGRWAITAAGELVLSATAGALVGLSVLKALDEVAA
jgi:hypothetical protein